MKIQGDSILLLVAEKKCSVKVRVSASVSFPSSSSSKASISFHIREALTLGGKTGYGVYSACPFQSLGFVVRTQISPGREVKHVKFEAGGEREWFPFGGTEQLTDTVDRIEADASKREDLSTHLAQS